MRKLLKQTNEFGGEHIIDRTLSIFNAIHSLQSNPFEWLTQAVADELDIEYYMNHSGDKSISPMFEKLLGIEGQTGATVVTQIAKIIVNRFKDKWDKLYSAFIDSDYAPLDNYSMEEVETPNITRDSTTKQKTKIETETEDDTSESKTYGFNSANAVPNAENVRNGKTTVSGDANDNETVTQDKETGTRTLTRHGNIGVTTSQQMLQSEINLRSNYNFIHMLYDDVDSVITLPIYF